MARLAIQPIIAIQPVIAIQPIISITEFGWSEFSLLKWMFGDQQMSALADIIQAALMLRYNKRIVG